MKLQKILFYIGLVIVTIGCLLIVAAAFIKDQKISDLLLGLSSILGVVSIALLIARLVIMSRNPTPFPMNENSKVVVKVVDVKDIPKSKEQKLYEQYEELYKKNLISKEDLDKKRQELLGK